MNLPGRERRYLCCARKCSAVRQTVREPDSRAASLFLALSPDATSICITSTHPHLVTSPLPPSLRRSVRRAFSKLIAFRIRLCLLTRIRANDAPVARRFVTSLAQIGGLGLPVESSSVPLRFCALFRVFHTCCLRI